MRPGAAMNNAELVTLIDRLCLELHETEWLEFKRNYYEPHLIGEYLSALANAACLAGKPRGYLVFGIDDKTHDVVGTGFDPYTVKAKGNQDLIIWLSMGLHPNVGFEAFIVDHPKGRVVFFEINAAWDRPVNFYGTAYIRVGTSKTELRNHQAKEAAIWNSRSDWSAQISERATLTDLDPEAILKAREQFKIKYPAQELLINEWNDATFLNKAKLTIQGAITNSAILLLGKSETATLLSPAVAKISWILKDVGNKELDYVHFGPPFILQVDLILQRIRNLTFRKLPGGTLFPQEIAQYDPWVIREALHNCIAHQDYSLRGRINVVETPTTILLTNAGSFLPGDVKTVIQQDAPLEIYRNPFLADAMVNLNMIDTQGGGIKKMFQSQAKRYFPLPDYELSNPDRVAVTIRGEILDEKYSALLMKRSDLDLWTIILLDKIQKRMPISHDDHRLLKTLGVVDGRYPNLFISGRLAKLTGQEARHIKDKGFNKQYYLDLIVRLIKEHGPVGRSKIDELMLDKLPEVLTEKQRKSKIHNMLYELSRNGVIINKGSRIRSKWEIVEIGGSISLANNEPA
ncbi:MAG TPA: transcriptional regulator [Euryarchaeota archaeon]|nr:transcriptional regulator [Euryarchaeota archaeon]